MTDLTLAQVRAANRPAIGIVDDCRGYIFFPGHGLFWFDWWMDVFEPDKDNGAGADQWRHLDGCDCEFCRE